MNDQAKQILEFAVAKEKAAEAFYTRWSAKCPTDLAKVLHDLAREEHDHQEKLSLVTPEDLIAEGLAPAEFGLVKDLPEAPEDEENLTPLDVLSIGIQREEASVVLYERLLASSPHHEALFKALIEQERRHKHRLELQYALLESRSNRT
jgi:rubrerythrin